jgi:hypothetical protein
MTDLLTEYWFIYQGFYICIGYILLNGKITVTHELDVKWKEVIMDYLKLLPQGFLLTRLYVKMFDGTSISKLQQSYVAPPDFQF